MRVSPRLILALGLAGLLFAPSAAGRAPPFFHQLKPLFAHFGEPSLAKAQKDGVTRGFSVNPPEAWLDEQTKQANGIDWDINKAALDWMGVKTIKQEAQKIDEQQDGASSPPPAFNFAVPPHCHAYRH